MRYNAEVRGGGKCGLRRSDIREDTVVRDSQYILERLRVRNAIGTDAVRRLLAFSPGLLRHARAEAVRGGGRARESVCRVCLVHGKEPQPHGSRAPIPRKKSAKPPARNS